MFLHSEKRVRENCLAKRQLVYTAAPKCHCATASSLREAQRRSNLLFAADLSTNIAQSAKSAAFAEQNRQLVHIVAFWANLYTCFRAAEHMYIIFQVLCSAQNLQRCTRLSLFCRLSICAPEPRASALHTVCCNETIYVSLRDATN